MSVASPEIPQALWTTVCPNCGYSLKGLAGTGTCPECGRDYDQSQVILHGWGRGGHENIATAKRSRIFLVAAGSLFVFIVNVLQVGILNRKNIPFLAPIVAVLLLLYFLYCFIRRQSTDHPGLVQVRLSNSGCVQYDKLAETSPLWELWRAYAWLLPTAAATGLIVALRRDWIEFSDFIVLFILALIFEPVAWQSSYRFRKAMRTARGGSIADRNAALYEPTPWKNVTDYDLIALPRGGYRLTLSANFGFFSFRSRVPVDIEMDCTAECAEQLKYLVAQWVAGSR